MSLQRTRSRRSPSLTPMILAIAASLAVVALLAWSVMPSRGNDDNGIDRPDPDGIIAPEIAFDEATGTPEGNESRVTRVDEPLILEPSPTPSETASTGDVEELVPTDTPVTFDFKTSTPRVIVTATPRLPPTEVDLVPTIRAPTRVPQTPVPEPTRPPRPSATPTRVEQPQPTATARENTPIPLVTSTPTRQPTVVPTATMTVTPTAFVPTPTATALPPTATATATPEAPTATVTPEATSTSTPEPTETPDDEPTRTPSPSATHTREPTDTPTVIPGSPGAGG